MRKHLRVGSPAFALLTFALLMFAVTPASANDFRYLFNAGVSYPLAPGAFNDNWQIGFNLGLGLERRIDGPWYWQISFDYNNFGIEEEQYTKWAGYYEPGLSVDGGTTSIIVVGANLKRMMTRARSGEAPYLIGGVGLYRFQLADGYFATRDTSINIVSYSENSVGANIGAGVDVRIGARTSFYLEARYFIGFTSDEATQHVPFRVGIIFK